MRDTLIGISIGKNAIILGVFAIFTAGALAFIHASTAERIAAQEKRAAAKALLEIVPRALHDNDMLESTWPVPEALWPELGLRSATNIHVATRAETPVALIIPAVAPDGYSGDITMLVGVLTDGTISGVRVLSHKETPGLGDKIDLNKSDWILNFDGLSLANPESIAWQVKKDGGQFDQFTGATITPRAVIGRIKKTLVFFGAHKNTILSNYSGEASDD